MALCLDSCGTRIDLIRGMCALGMLLAPLAVWADEPDEGEMNLTPPAGLMYGPGSEPGSESIDIVFVIDGSGSMPTHHVCEGAFQLQKKAIISTFKGPYAFIPHNGKAAIAVIQFATSAVEEVALTVIANDSVANDLADQIDAINRRGGGTNLSTGLNMAFDVFEDEAVNPLSHRFGKIRESTLDS